MWKKKNQVSSSFPWVLTRASTGAGTRQAALAWRWSTPKKVLHCQPRGATTMEARAIQTPSQGSYYRMVAKFKLQILPLNIRICHLSRMPPILPCHILFHRHAILKQAGTPQQPESRVHWSDYRLGIRLLGRFAKPLKLQAPPRIECLF